MLEPFHLSDCFVHNQILDLAKKTEPRPKEYKRRFCWLSLCFQEYKQLWRMQSSHVLARSHLPADDLGVLPCISLENCTSPASFWGVPALAPHLLHASCFLSSSFPSVPSLSCFFPYTHSVIQTRICGCESHAHFLLLLKWNSNPP